MMASMTARPTRRVVLLSGLALAFGVSACGRTQVTDSPATTPGAAEGTNGTTPAPLSTELTGDYAIDDPTTGTRMTVTVSGQVRSIHANGLPDHATGAFPNPNNPNRIGAQSYAFDLPLLGTRAAAPTALVLPQPFGIAINGVLFDPLAAEWYRGDRDSGWTIEAIRPTGTILGLDQNNAHVQPSGAYHYHGLPTGVVTDHGGSAHGPLVGWAGDGFPIYAGAGYRDPQDPTSPVATMQPSYRLRTGSRASGPGGTFDGTYTEDYEYVEGYGDLDAANGRTAVTPEYPGGTYHYVLTTGFPYVPRLFTGVLAGSFRVAGPPRR
jgi:hypothetical protein